MPGQACSTSTRSCAPTAAPASEPVRSGRCGSTTTLAQTPMPSRSSTRSGTRTCRLRRLPAMSESARSTSAAASPTVLPAEASGLRVAIVGTGPSACYAVAELLERRPGVAISVLDRCLTPYGLVRAGVAPDHHDTKLVTGRFESVLAHPAVSMRLGVGVGRDLSHDELLRHHHAVIYATGTPHGLIPDLVGVDGPGSHAATDFAAWYNGNPDDEGDVYDLSSERAVIIGNWNVALHPAPRRGGRAPRDHGQHARPRSHGQRRGSRAGPGTHGSDRTPRLHRRRRGRRHPSRVARGLVDDRPDHRPQRRRCHQLIGEAPIPRPSSHSTRRRQEQTKTWTSAQPWSTPSL